MSNTEWTRHPEVYARWGGEDLHVHPHHTFEEEEYEETTDEEYDEETTYEEYEGETTYEEGYSSIYEDMLADSFVHDATLVAGTMKLSVSSEPRLTISEGVPITFNYSDKATITQEVADGQLSLTVQENDALQSIKICIDNRTWVIPLDAFPISPPLMPKKR